MDRDALSALLAPVREIAEAAGRAIMSIYARGAAVTIKADGSPLTEADLAANEVIQSGLGTCGLNLPIVSEESGLAPAIAGSPETYWLVDPLDGTKEFVKGLDEFTVNIALVEQGAAILGVVCAPAVGLTYYAATGGGAWKIAQESPAQRITASQRRRPTAAVVSRSHLDASTEAFLERLGVSDVIKRGSSLKLCAVADGQAEIYPRSGPTCLWDTAAGAAVAREAGCRVVDWHGDDLSYDLTRGLKHSGFVVYSAKLHLEYDFRE